MKSFFSIDQATALDQADSMSHIRQQFHIPQVNGEDCLYFTGNSLGLQPKAVEAALALELHDWKTLGVEGHFHASNPWMPYHEQLTASLARLVGAKDSEVVAMGSLTSNLHLLLASFYCPTQQRPLLLCEAKAFPSDRYALMGQLQWHGLDASQLLEVHGDGHEGLPTTDNIIQAIEEQGEQVATLMIGGVNYLTGQVYDMQAITKAAHAKGILVGFDLAHGIGNASLNLHEWGVDFAAWCSYKYLNAGPGGVAGIYVHERHHGGDRPILAGWWGHDKSTRFSMPTDFSPIQGAEAWQVSNAPILSMASLKASLSLFDEVDLDELRKKSLAQSRLLMDLLTAVSDDLNEPIHLITPREDAERAGQVSVAFLNRDRGFFDQLLAHGIIADWREPGTIRFAVAPLYTSYRDLARLEATLRQALAS